MATETYKVLAQANPAATTLTDIYTVPVDTATVISSIIVANRGNASDFRLAIARNGAADSNEQYLAYDTRIQSNGVQEFTIGITLEAGDVIRAYAADAQFSFNVFGTEITDA